MIVERFKPEHLENLVLQPAQEYARATLAEKGYGDSLAKFDAFSALDGARVIACAGVIPVGEGRGEAWALIARDIGARGMHELHYAVRRYLKGSDLRRVEACCDATFEQAHRWLMLLGFSYEGPLRKYFHDGRDGIRFAMVR